MENLNTDFLKKRVLYLARKIPLPESKLQSYVNGSKFPPTSTENVNVSVREAAWVDTAIETEREIASIADNRIEIIFFA